MRLRLGTPVRCSDGLYGELCDVVVDPAERKVTHLVVEPHHEHRSARLVPIELVGAGEDPEAAIELRCATEHVRGLEEVQEFAFVRIGEPAIDDPRWDVGIETALALPYSDATSPMDPVLASDSSVSVSFDRVPKGEVEIRRESIITSSDGHEIGRVDGFEVDAGGAITHLVLRRGHLWGRREVAIPVAAVAEVETDRVTLSLSKDAVGEMRARR